MNRQRIASITLWTLLYLTCVGLVIGISYRFSGEIFAVETRVSLGLITVNMLFFLTAALLPLKGELWNGPITALIWITLKLFVNTLTIFLFIGLHAGRTHVFVYGFFGAYFLLLMGSVCLLNRKF
jgi:hypothetical protein